MSSESEECEDIPDASDARTHPQRLALVSTVCCRDLYLGIVLEVDGLPLSGWESWEGRVLKVSLGRLRLELEVWRLWLQLLPSSNCTKHHEWAECCLLSKIASRMHLESPISLSQDPPMWDAWGGLNTHSQCSSLKNFSIFTFGSFWPRPSSFAAATKFASVWQVLRRTALVCVNAAGSVQGGDDLNVDSLNSCSRRVWPTVCFQRGHLSCAWTQLTRARRRPLQHTWRVETLVSVLVAGRP